MYAIATTMLQKHLNDCWAIADDPQESVAKVVAWLRKGGHSTIDDEASKLVADLMEAGKRTV